MAIDLVFDEDRPDGPSLGDRTAVVDAPAGPGSGPVRLGSVPGSGPARRAKTWQIFAVLLLLACALRLPAFFVEVFNSDETFLATQAEVINEGGRLYEDAADRKPPLVPYLYAATFSVLGTTALWSVRLVAMLAVALTGLLLALEARRRYGERAAWFAGILFVLASVAFAPQDGQAANFEIFMLPAMTAAVLLGARGKTGASGVAVAIATLAKQTGAATILPVLYLVWRARGKRGIGEAAAGFAIPIAIVAILVGPGELFFWTLLGNGSYFGLGSASAYVLGLFAVMTFAFVACNLPIVWSLPRAWRERKLPSATRVDGAVPDKEFAGPDTDLWIWLLSAALSVAVGFRFFGHYYLQLLPPLCLLTSGAVIGRSHAAPARDRRLRGGRRGRCVADGLLGEAVGRRPEVRSWSAATSTPTRSRPTASSCGATCPRSTGRATGGPRAASSAAGSRWGTGAAGPRATRRRTCRRRARSRR